MMESHHEYLTKVKEDGTIASTLGPATVISNLLVKGPMELSGHYHQ